MLHDDLKINSLREELWYPLQHIDADSEVQVTDNVCNVLMESMNVLLGKDSSVSHS